MTGSVTSHLSFLALELPAARICVSNLSLLVFPPTDACAHCSSIHTLAGKREPTVTTPHELRHYAPKVRGEGGERGWRQGGREEGMGSKKRGQQSRGRESRQASKIERARDTWREGREHG